MAVILIMIAFMGCKENSTTPAPDPTTSKTMYTMKEGSYWINKWYTIDSNSIKSSPSKYDSTFVDSKTVWLSNEAFSITRISGTEDSKFTNKDLSYYASFNDTQYLISGSFLNMLIGNLPKQITDMINVKLPFEKWYLIADNNKNEFPLFDTPFSANGVKLPQDTNIVADTKFNINIRRSGNTTIADPNNTNNNIPGVIFEIICKLDFEITYKGTKLPLPNPSIELKSNLTFGQGVGLVKFESPTQDIKYAIDLLVLKYDLFKFRYLGRGFEVIRYKN